MYVDYRIINEKEVEVINDKGENLWKKWILMK